MFSSSRSRVALITGASKGIGKGIAQVFARLGIDLVLVARNIADGETTAAELRAGGARASFYEADVSDLASMQKAAEAAKERYGKLDILCANAGIFKAAPLTDLLSDQWDETFRINVRGALFSVQACIPLLRQSEAGRIVLTSSITGPITGFPGWSHYGATKAAQLGFIRTAALELARDRITINAVLPGNIETEGLAGLGDSYRQQMIRSIPLQRLGTPEDIGFAVAFLASPEAKFITGQTLIVDGGQVLPESISALEPLA